MRDRTMEPGLFQILSQVPDEVKVGIHVLSENIQR